MKKHFKALILFTLGLISINAKASLPDQIQEGSTSSVEQSDAWEELCLLLQSNRLPRSYYKILEASGIRSIDELRASDNIQLKNYILRKFIKDKAQMYASDKVRSFV